jgi:D-sedoheptulose 7-phosphate isomerase
MAKVPGHAPLFDTITSMSDSTNNTDPVHAAFAEARATLDAFISGPGCLDGITELADLIQASLAQGGRLHACGNGGSMCDAMHFVEEWTGRFRGNRDALSALSMGDPAQLTCIANDFGFDEIFSRQIEANGRPGDLLLVISTSGNSANLVRAVEAAKERGLVTTALLGKGGGQLAPMVDHAITVPLATTSDRIQEVHIKIIHTVIEAVERRLFPGNYA